MMMNDTNPIAHGHLCPDCALDYDCTFPLCEHETFVPCSTCDEADEFDASQIDEAELDEVLARLEPISADDAILDELQMRQEFEDSIDIHNYPEYPDVGY